MPQITYLLVQEQTSTAYRIHGLGISEDFPNTSKIQVLLDDAAEAGCALMGLDSAQGVTLIAYKLLNPIADFRGWSLGDIESKLGEINEDFLRNKAAQCPHHGELSLLEADDNQGKVLVVFKMRVKPMHRLSEENTFSHLKRAKLATTAPSTIANPSTYESMQRKSNEKILNDRPEPDDEIPPIPLLYNGFGHFLDILDGDADILGLDKVDSSKLRLEVNEFACNMCYFYAMEDDRRDKALPALDKIFAARSGVKIPTIHAAAIGSVRSDGDSVGKHGGVVLTTKFKNRVARITAIPEVELVGYVARSHVKGMEEMRELFERWRVPCLGLTVVGSDVKFYAVIVLDSRYRLVSLTPALSCIRSALDGCDRTALYTAFTTASVLQAHIVQDIDRYLAALPPKIPDGAHRCPAISKLRRYGSLSDDYLTFGIQKLHPCKQSQHLLYIAETEDPDYQTVLIKFVQGYLAELHAFCADSNHAPHILAFEKLPGGWLAVAMEYISSGVTITTAALSWLASCRERWASQLWKLVKSFHDSGFVHGDLRVPNIICDDKDRVLLIDFDWSGKEGQVSYPTPNLNKELLAGRTLGDLKITKGDDERVLQRTLDKLKM
ncbi:unnamed protein product [Cyclocybe aegerita]|uniref:Aminoglycoside phosphotransferase domain-containing protein n=1 Tax=Cyclocybe aegerita TaxID=1973307 RepID=A0A8S0Y041_CYCAE|nr:unnamed protein product [Cyclocybe aegerita]